MRSRSIWLAVLGAAALLASVPAPASALNDPEYALQWGTELIGAKSAWDAGLFGQGVRIGVLDTGVHFGHFEFNGRLVAGPNVIDPSKPPQDDGHSASGSPQGHGTHVAGIAAAGIDQGGTVGVAPKATVVAVKVLDRTGFGETNQILTALRWAADQGIEVINLSLGSVAPEFFDDPATIATVEYAWSKGSIVVFAAGNSYVFGTEYRNLRAIVVAASTRADGKAYFSSSVANTRWALAAPGGAASPTSDSADRIFAPAWESDAQNNTYRYLQGTSQAAPHVAGAAALLRGAGLSPQQTVDRLLATAKDLGPPGRDDTFGAGRLDVAKATAGLSAIGPTTSVPVPSPAPTTTPTTTATSPAPPSSTPGATRSTITRPPATTPANPQPTTTEAPTTAPPDTALPPDAIVQDDPIAGARTLGGLDDAPSTASTSDEESSELPWIVVASVLLAGVIATAAGGVLRHLVRSRHDRQAAPG